MTKFAENRTDKGTLAQKQEKDKKMIYLRNKRQEYIWVTRME